ncbi:hypothetical protein GQ42DRAFT_162094 [Ramicandelaber brevisporus]|nr:hypothetical protein GQ42DRAFT_162094 [Ramicandelaber brevisporus]
MVDSDWLQATSLVDIRSSKLTSISISETMVSHRLFETLLTLPSLHGLGLWYCVLAEPELVMSVFKRHRETDKEDATVDVRRFAISTPRVDNNWSTGIVFEMIASFTRLESCRIYGNDALRNAIKEIYPELF